MFVSWISSLETKRKMPNSCPSLVFLRFLQTAGGEEDEVLSNSCSNKLGSKTQPQMAAVPQAKSKPYHWLCLGTWRRQHLTLEKSTYQYLIMILLFYVLSIWWNIMEVIWNLVLHLFTILRYIVVFIIVWSDSCIWCVLWTHWVCLVLFHCLIELDDGKIYRKPLYLMVKTMVSCRFSLKPIHWLSPLMLQCSSRVTRDRSKISGRDWVDCGKRCKGICETTRQKRRKKSGSWNMLRPQMGQYHFNFGILCAI